MIEFMNRSPQEKEKQENNGCLIKLDQQNL